MGLFDSISSIFSPSEKTIDPVAPTITQAPIKTKEQEEFLKSLIASLQPVTEAGGRVQPFPGQLTAGPSALQEQLFGNVGQLTGEAGPFGRGLEALQAQLADFDPASTQQFFGQAIEAPALRRFEEDILPAISESFAGTGVSGGLLRARQRAGTDLSESLNTTLANLLFTGEQAQLNRQGGALNVALGLPLEAGQQIGAEQRGIEQQGLSAILNEFIRSQGIDPLLQLAPTALGINTFENIIQTPDTAFGPSAATQIGGLLSGAGGLATGIGSFFS